MSLETGGDHGAVGTKSGYHLPAHGAREVVAGSWVPPVNDNGLCSFCTPFHVTQSSRSQSIYVARVCVWGGSLHPEHAALPLTQLRNCSLICQAWVTVAPTSRAQPNGDTRKALSGCLVFDKDAKCSSASNTRAAVTTGHAQQLQPNSKQVSPAPKSP